MNFAALIKDIFVYQTENPLLFNSSAFFILFICFLSVYTVIHKYKLAVSLYVVAFSLFFYYKSSGIYFILLVLTTIKDYYLAQIISQTKDKKKRKLWVTISVSTSLGVLAYYKYTDFFISNIGYLVQTNFQPWDIFLPIGISFFTFQSISYILDVHFEKLPPSHRIIDYAFFLSYFPQLVAGPIVKANHFLPQLKKPIKIQSKEVFTGLFFIIVGLLKKAVIADYISQYNDLVFGDPAHYSGFENLMAVYGYTLQIFCDFSGYSDMAIGLGKVMGFDLGINFRFPYQALNITDFWRRWHISLSTWLKDYLYIPLGGNRKGKARMYINLFITMLLGGLWHGASWKFVFWGGMHGIGLAVHKALKPYLNKKVPENFFTKFISWFITFHFVIFLWIYFRAPDFKTASLIISQILTEFNLNYFLPFIQSKTLWVILLSLGFISHTINERQNKKIIQSYLRLPYVIKIITFIIVVQLVIQFRLEDVQPFIYFQF